MVYHVGTFIISIYVHLCICICTRYSEKKDDMRGFHANCNVTRYMYGCLCTSYYNISCAHHVHKNDNKSTHLVVILLTTGVTALGGSISGPSLYYIACHSSA